MLFAQGLNIESRYSPLNSKRSPRKSTQYIILHTTEGGGKGSLNKLRKYGEAHYMLDVDGKVYRIIEKHRIAMHAGRSMWNGQTNLDNISIGIEIVGYHDKPLTQAQKQALRELLRQLKVIYKIPDDHVLPHSMVAYGRPNRWHSVSHRGRKRCAMLLGRDDYRREIGLLSKPAFDPDVRSGRLKVADDYLNKVLFTVIPIPVAIQEQVGATMIARGRSAWDIAKENYNSPGTVYIFPNGTQKRGNEITDWNKIPPGTQVRIGEALPEEEQETEKVQVIGKDGSSAAEIAGSAISRESTIYFTTDGQVKQGNELSAERLLSLPKGTGMLVGYVHGGVIRSNRRSFDICGPRWNLPTTFYRLPDGSIRSGDEMDERSIPLGTMVFFQP
ncbi:N-acetylmuramoyl-L-alanine amidase [Kiritimatiellota bacterium B12222]|nr:N-acetylmuramoyl-L-alanine amidase [Kiritimatiellota bacterium B12222]